MISFFPRNGSCQLKQWVLCLLFYPLPPPLLANFSLSKYLFGAKISFRYGSARQGIVLPIPLKSQTKYHSERCANFGGFPNALKTLNLSKQKKDTHSSSSESCHSECRVVDLSTILKNGVSIYFFKIFFQNCLNNNQSKKFSSSKIFWNPCTNSRLEWVKCQIFS